MPDQIIKQPQRLPIPRSMYDSRQTGGANAQQQRSQLSQTNDSLDVPNPAPQPINGNAITGGRGIAQGSGLQFAGQGGLNALPDTLQIPGTGSQAFMGQSANDKARRSQDPVLSRGVGAGAARTHSARPGVTGNDIDRLNGAKSFGNILTDSSLLTGGNNGLNRLTGGHSIGMAPPSSLPAAGADSSVVADPMTNGQSDSGGQGTQSGGTQPYNPNLHNPDGSPKRPGVLPATPEGSGVGTSSSGLLYDPEGTGGGDDTPDGNTGNAIGGGDGHAEGWEDSDAVAKFSQNSGIDPALVEEIMRNGGIDWIDFDGPGGDDGYQRTTDPLGEHKEGERWNDDQGNAYIARDGEVYKLVDNDMDDSDRVNNATTSLGRRKTQEADTALEEKAAKSRKEAEAYIRELMGMEAPTLDQKIIDEQIGAQKSASDMERQKAIAMSLRMGSDPESMQSQTTGINQHFGVNDVQQQSQIKMQAAVQNLQSKMAQYQNNINSLMQLANMTNDDGVRAQARQAQLAMMEMRKRGEMELMQLQQKMNEPNFGRIMASLGGGIVSGLTGGLVGAIANPLLGGLSNAVGGLVGNSRPGGY